jgi:hypothetical protein
VFLFDFLQEKWQILLKNWASVEIYYKILKIWQKVFKIFAESRAYFQFLAGEIPRIPLLIGNPERDYFILILKLDLLCQLNSKMQEAASREQNKKRKK